MVIETCEAAEILEIIKNLWRLKFNKVYAEEW